MKTAYRWIPTWLWMGIIFAFSSRPSDELPDFGLYDLLVKKGGHMLGYAILAWLFFRSWQGSGLSRSMAYILAFLSSVLYAISDEIHQAFVPGRHARITDVLIDTVGILLALWMVHLYQKDGLQSRMQ